MEPRRWPGHHPEQEIVAREHRARRVLDIHEGHTGVCRVEVDGHGEPERKALCASGQIRPTVGAGGEAQVEEAFRRECGRHARARSKKNRVAKVLEHGLGLLRGAGR